MAARADVPVDIADQLWRLLGFPRAADDDVAFTEGDVVALRLASDLVALGILSPERQAALVRTWGRSFARLAEWQTALLADVAVERGDDATERVGELAEQVLPRVAQLQDYVWRRHLAGASARALGPGPDATVTTTVGFVDIVGFTSRSKELTEAELVGWIEHFEARCTDLVTEHGGRIIKSIGDAVLWVGDDPAATVETALLLVERGADDTDTDFPPVRAGVAYGEVVPRLGDVYGPTVNIASRLTALARPGTVLVDQGAHDALTGDAQDGPFHLRRLRRTSVKGYSRLPSWAVRRAR